jgi:serine/threonine protein phosphatase PrpC
MEMLSPVVTIPVATVEIVSGAEHLEPEPRPFLQGKVALFSVRAPGKTSSNEDAAALISIDDHNGLIVVADGLGGHADGALASRLAIDELVAATREVMASGGGLREAVLQGIDAANQAIIALANGAATTLAITEISPAGMRTYHVGDSSILVIGQRGLLKQQTIQHSPIGHAVESGLLDEAGAMQSEERHLVSNVVGSTDMRVELGPLRKLATYDTVVMASDGLADNLMVNEIIEHVRKGPLARAAANLLSACLHAMQKGGHPDDLTVALYRPSGR